MTDFTQRIVDEFRSQGGTVSTGGFGSSLVLLHSLGARSGEWRLAPVMSIAQPDGSWLIAASKAGAPDNPAWYGNLLAHPEARIEVPAAPDVETVDVTAHDLVGAERDAAWAQFTERSDGFRQYQERTGGRIIPVLRLERR